MFWIGKQKIKFKKILSLCGDNSLPKRTVLIHVPCLFQVKLWITFNEPFVVSWLGYGIAVMAPGVYDPGVGVYQVTHHIIKSHVKAYHIYNDQFRSRYNGKYLCSTQVQIC